VATFKLQNMINFFLVVSTTNHTLSEK